MITEAERMLLALKRPELLDWSVIEPLTQYWQPDRPTSEELTELIDRVWPDIRLAPEFGFAACQHQVQDPSRLLLWVFRRRSRDLGR